MKPVTFALALGLSAWTLAPACIRGEDAKKPEAETPVEKKAEPDKDAKLTQEQLEEKFKTTLTKATLSGRWCMVKDGKLSSDKEEKYTITGVTKLFGERWLIRARIQYGDHDVTAPIPVKVKWAGDTPVITVDDFGLPGGASYSARVLIYGGTYAGTWSAGDHGGLLNGVVVYEKE